MDRKRPENGKHQELRIVSEEEHMRLQPEEKKLANKLRPSQISSENNVHFGQLRGVAPSTGNIEDLDREKEWGSKKSIANGWFVIMLLIIASVALWAVFAVYMAQGDINKIDKKRDAQKQVEVDDTKEIRAMLVSLKQAIRVYLAAETVEAKLLYSRHPKRVRPLMRKFYSEEKLEPEKFIDFDKLSMVALESHSFIILEIITDTGIRNLTIEQLSDGRFLIDWETDVHFQPMVWSDFLREKPTEPVAMRVSVRKDDFYAYEFGDENKFQCYRVTDREKKEHVFAYVERGSDVMRDIQRVVGMNSAKGAGLILKLRFSEGSDVKRYVIIDECVSNQWIHVKSPSQ